MPINILLQLTVSVWSSAAAVRSRTTVRTGLLVRFSVVRSMVPSPARTGPESGSGFWTFTSGPVLVRLSRTFLN
ncbi:uncharacterized protein F5147DRAFT_710477, partial [Suillus discolor]